MSLAGRKAMAARVVDCSWPSARRALRLNSARRRLMPKQRRRTSRRHRTNGPAAGPAAEPIPRATGIAATATALPTERRVLQPGAVGLHNERPDALCEAIPRQDGVQPDLRLRLRGLVTIVLHGAQPVQVAPVDVRPPSRTHAAHKQGASSMSSMVSYMCTT